VSTISPSRENFYANEIEVTYGIGPGNSSNVTQIERIANEYGKYGPIKISPQSGFQISFTFTPVSTATGGSSGQIVAPMGTPTTYTGSNGDWIMVEQRDSGVFEVVDWKIWS